MRSFMSPGLLQLSVYLGRTDAVRTVQSAAARLITATRRSDHMMPVLRQLHWLPATPARRLQVCVARSLKHGT